MRAVALAVVLACCGRGEVEELGREPTQGDQQRASAEAKSGGERAPIAMSFSGLLAEGAEARIQSALVERGYLEEGEFARGELDDATQAALRRLQGEHGLPKTGLPDDATLRRLGLEPRELRRRAG